MITFEGGDYGYRIDQEGEVLQLLDDIYSNTEVTRKPVYSSKGLHDATWRGSFGGSIYQSNGSHGCVKMPYSAAQTAYEAMEERTASSCTSKTKRAETQIKPQNDPSCRETSRAGGDFLWLLSEMFALQSM